MGLCLSRKGDLISVKALEMERSEFLGDRFLKTNVIHHSYLFLIWPKHTARNTGKKETKQAASQALPLPPCFFVYCFPVLSTLFSRKGLCVVFINLGATSDWAQEILLALSSGITPGSAQWTIDGTRSEPTLALCKTRALPAGLFLSPSRKSFRRHQDGPQEAGISSPTFGFLCLSL